MKKLLVLVLLIAAAAYFYREQSRPPIETRTSYAEARYKLKFESRDFDMVLIGERPDRASCVPESVIKEFQNACDADSFCTTSSFECKLAIAPRYQKMLDKMPAATHFVHLQFLTDQRRAAVLIWGLTADESLAACQTFAAKFKNELGAKVAVQCI